MGAPPPSILPPGAVGTDEPHGAVLPPQQSPAAWEGAPSAAPWRTPRTLHWGQCPPMSLSPCWGHPWPCSRCGAQAASALSAPGWAQRLQEGRRGWGTGAAWGRTNKRREGEGGRSSSTRQYRAVIASNKYFGDLWAGSDRPSRGGPLHSSPPLASLPFIPYLSALFQLCGLHSALPSSC